MDLFVVGLLIALYFLPSIIAIIRDPKHSGSIGLVNLFLGWTIIGWFAALIWAIVEKREVISSPSS